MGHRGNGGGLSFRTKAIISLLKLFPTRGEQREEEEMYVMCVAWGRGSSAPWMLYDSVMVRATNRKPSHGKLFVALQGMAILSVSPTSAAMSSLMLRTTSNAL